MTTSFNQQVSTLQKAVAAAEAEKSRWDLEYTFAPNQVLKPGAASLIRRLIEGLPDSTAAGATATWELLAHLAPGACEPTAADLQVVAQARETLLSVVPIAASWLSKSTAQQDDYLVVDVLDACLEFVDEPHRTLAIRALSQFAAQGPSQLARVKIIFN